MNSTMSMEPKYTHAIRFAQYLRRNGNKVINGSCKLSLTTSALCLLNTVFAEVLNQDWPESLNVVNSTDVIEDVKYLYDFMKKTSFLKLFHSGQTLRGGIDLSQFSSLTVLELRKIPFHLIVGLECLSVQLKAIICSRSIYLLKEIFQTHGNEENTTTVWPELKELNLSYNYLEYLDESIRNLPNVEILEMSHNHLRNTDEIQVLKNLVFVNLSYNELEHLPTLHISSCRSLTKLYMRNNNLEDLEGIDCLFNLEELDVAYNLLSGYHTLSPLDKLKVLRSLNLEGNPLYFHKQHSTLVTSYINPFSLTRGFQLNGKMLALSQMVQRNDVNNSFEGNAHQTSINTVVGDAESLNSIPRPAAPFLRNFSEISEGSSFDGNSVSSVASLSGSEQIAVGVKLKNRKSRRKKSKAGKRPNKGREVLINEYEHQDVEVKPNTVIIEAEIPSHMKTKEALEARRVERGEAWLIPDNSYQRLSKSTPQVPANTPMSTVPSPLQLSESDVLKKIRSSLEKDKMSPTDATRIEILSSTPVAKEMTEVVNIGVTDHSVGSGREVTPENDDIEVLSENCGSDCDETRLHVALSKDDLSDCDIYGANAVETNNFEEELESEEESEDSIFFVTRQDELKKFAVTVAIGVNYIKEKDLITANIIDRLDLNVLQSVSTISKKEDGYTYCEVQLEFDTVKTSRQKRIYIFEDLKNAKAMTRILQPFADAKTLKEVTLGALECMKCRSQFSRQGAHKILMKTKKRNNAKDASYDSSREYPVEVDACPNCKNHILIELDSIPMPSAAMPPKADDLCGLRDADKSPDTLSTGSGSSGKLFSNLFTSFKVSPLLKRKDSLSRQGSQSQDLNPSNKESTQRASERKISSNGSNMSRNSSDITIISDPSQSNLLVCPEPEMNLNTITERDSQSSLSPPASQDTYYSPKTTEFHVYAGISDADTRDPVSPPPGNLENDFHSIPGSETPDRDVMSSNSDPFLSPLRSAGSPKSESNLTSSSREVDEGTQILSILSEKRTINHDTFSEIDHRLKLHLEINVFGNEEELEFCLQSSIVPLSTGDEFTGLFAVSTKKLYVIKFLPLYSLSLSQSEPMEKGIQIVHSSPLSQLKQVKVILGNQGLTFTCGSSYGCTLVVRDADICNSFSSLLSDFLLERLGESTKVEFLSSTDETLQLIKDSVFAVTEPSVEVPEVLLHLFGFWKDSLSRDKDSSSSTPVCVIVTADSIYISKILYKKQDSVSDLRNLNVFHYSLVDRQNISDLLAVKLKGSFKTAVFNFLNESSCQEVFWTLEMETKSALFSLISAVRSPWEEIFGVPLSLSRED